MKSSHVILPTEYHLLRDAVQSFFQTLHEIIPCHTFFVAENKGSTYTVLSAWNAGEKLVREGDSLSLPVTGSLGACSFLGFPIMLRDGRMFGQICALDRKHAFSREDAKLLERMADLISRLVEAEESVIFDELTGVYRRKYAEALFYNFAANGKKAVVFLDLDNFKGINDTYGHDAGDEVLKSVGAILQEMSIVHRALVCRYAGDEFVVILPYEEEGGVMEAVDYLVDRMSRPFRAGRHDLAVSASIGVCLEAGTLQEYIQRADAAMYQIKRGDKSGVQVYVG